MEDDAKIKRALYLKGLLPGKTATIELAAPISGRNVADEYVHLAEKGEHVQATLAADSWVVAIPETDEVLAQTANIPLSHGKVR
jgi:hypothetical protein